MIRGALVVALGTLAIFSPRSAWAGPSSGKPERLWLVIGAADPTPAGITRKAKTLAGAARGGGLVFQLSDCGGEKKKLLLWATTVATTEKEAHAALVDVRDTIKKAVVKRCDARPGSLLALRYPAVDGSLAEAPKPSSSWSATERMANLWPLAGGRAVVIAHYFVHQPEDPLQGRRERVLLILAKDQKKILTDDCPSAAALVVDDGGTKVALQCSGEPAGGERYHTTLAFDVDGAQLAQVQHCRKPRFVDGVLLCDEEAVDREGIMKLHPKGTQLAK